MQGDEFYKFRLELHSDNLMAKDPSRSSTNFVEDCSLRSAMRMARRSFGFWPEPNAAPEHIRFFAFKITYSYTLALRIPRNKGMHKMGER